MKRSDINTADVMFFREIEGKKMEGIILYMENN